MSNLAIVLAALAGLSGSLHIVAEYRAAAGAKRWPIYLLKPFTMLMLLSLAWLLPAWSADYQQLIVLGLCLSLVGDIALMLPRRNSEKIGYLPVGLGSFLLAHLCYIVAFWPTAFVFSAAFVLFCLAVAAAAAWLLRTLWHDFGPLLIPGQLYVLAISLMAILAWHGYLAGMPWGPMALIGALFFMFSDTALAFNRIRKPYPHAQLLILSSYYVAQFFIACSIAG